VLRNLGQEAVSVVRLGVVHELSRVSGFHFADLSDLHYVVVGS